MTTRRHSYEYVKKAFEKRGCELLSTNYINSKEKLKYRCVCGNISHINFGNFSQGQLCWECGRRRGGNRTYTLGKVKEIFSQEGCTLLEDKYVNPRTSMKYICKCGRESTIRLDNFLQGKRCQGCRADKLSGKGSPLWNEELTDEDRVKGRKYKEYNEWRKKVFERDEYTCVNCSERASGKLNAHHIISYTKHPELRTNVSNGVTLCEPCHLEYHREYTQSNANKETCEMVLRREHNSPPAYID